MNRSKLGLIGGCEVVVGSMRSHATNPLVTIRGCEVIARLVDVSTENLALVKIDLVRTFTEVLTEALSLHPANDEVEVAAKIALAKVNRAAVASLTGSGCGHSATRVSFES